MRTHVSVVYMYHITHLYLPQESLASNINKATVEYKFPTPQQHAFWDPLCWPIITIMPPSLTTQSTHPTDATFGDYFTVSVSCLVQELSEFAVNK